VVGRRPNLKLPYSHPPKLAPGVKEPSKSSEVGVAGGYRDSVHSLVVGIHKRVPNASILLQPYKKRPHPMVPNSCFLGPPPRNLVGRRRETKLEAVVNHR